MYFVSVVVLKFITCTVISTSRLLTFSLLLYLCIYHNIMIQHSPHSKRMGRAIFHCGVVGIRYHIMVPRVPGTVLVPYYLLPYQVEFQKLQYHYPLSTLSFQKKMMTAACTVSRIIPLEESIVETVNLLTCRNPNKTHGSKRLLGP